MRIQDILAKPVTEDREPMNTSPFKDTWTNSDAPHTKRKKRAMKEVEALVKENQDNPWDTCQELKEVSELMNFIVESRKKRRENQATKKPA